MNKLAVTLLFITTTLLNIGCTNDNYSLGRKDVVSTKNDLIINNEDNEEVSTDLSESKKSNTSNIIDIPIELLSKYSKETKYLQIKEDTTMEEKIEEILNVISKECFNGLPLKSTIYGDEMAKIELVELEDEKNNRASWKEDYLNEENKRYTINAIVKNVLQEEYKGSWIKTVQLYYEEELITLD